MVGKLGIEPRTLGLEDRCSIQLSYLSKAQPYHTQPYRVTPYHAPPRLSKPYAGRLNIKKKDESNTFLKTLNYV